MSPARGGWDTAAWGDALDALATRLRAQLTFLAGDGACPEGNWIPPAGPLPAEYRPRAMVLLAQSRELETRASSRRPRTSFSSPYR
jgi:hypothetical protein